jgi:type VII secretion protein EccB
VATRRDQLQSYQFLVQRVVSALVIRDTDPQQPPFKRLSGGAFASIMVAILALAAVGVYGVIRPGGNKSWKNEGTVVLEKETGTQYVYTDGKLHPVANFASARLALGTAAVTKAVSANSLVGVPRGPMIGIADAPDSLPDPKRMLRAPWTLCSQPERDSSGRRVTVSVLFVGGQPSGGEPLGDRGLRVTEPESETDYLITKDHRFEIDENDDVLQALRIDDDESVPAGAAWLNAVPAGLKIGRIPVGGRGEVSRALDGARVGQVYVFDSEAEQPQYYLVRRAVLEPISGLQAEVVLNDPGTRVAYQGGTPEAKPLSQADGAEIADPPEEAGEEKPPETVPEIAPLPAGETSICAAFRDPDSAPEVLLGGTIADADRAVTTTVATEEGAALADRVLVEPGWGAIVEAVQSPQARSGSLYLITDQGVRYPVANEGVLGVLGYGKPNPTRLSASLVERIPEGPTLDPDAARKPVQKE